MWPSNKKIRVMVVDDSILARTMISNGLNASPQIEVVATAFNAKDAMAKVEQFKPDVITSDVEMPGMSGIDFLKQLLPIHPIPVILVSSLDLRVFDALSAGAVDFVRKPEPGKNDAFIHALIGKVITAKGAHVRPRPGIATPPAAPKAGGLVRPAPAAGVPGTPPLLGNRPILDNVIIALGGGSAMDAAKIMWVMYEHPEVDFMDMAMRFMDIRKRVYTFPKMGEKAYFIAIPTSAGTGSEVTPFAVITDQESGVKYPLADYELLPNMAIVDVDNMMSQPKGLTSASGVDVLTHALEAYASIMATDYTDGLALKAMKNVFEYLPRAYNDGTDLEARQKMADASCMAGMAFAIDLPLILVPVGIVYIIETLSDILQVAYFKLTHGKRIFKMAPIHHHFEMCGWSEVKIVTVFTAVSAVFCALALMGIMTL